MQTIDSIPQKDNPLLVGHAANTTNKNIGKAFQGLKKITVRKILLKMHLYISFALGGFLVLAGLTGSLLVYGDELDQWLNSGIMQVTASQQRRPLIELIAAANLVSPIKSPPTSIVLPKEPEDALIVRYQMRMQGNMTGHNHHIHEVMVNPFTGQVLGDRDRNSALIPFILQLHYKLLADDTGKMIMGITALFSLILTITGIYLWWPKLSKIKQAFLIKKNASFTRFNFDLHKTVGIYTAVVLFAVALSGVYFNLPQIFKPVVNYFSPLVELPKKIKSQTTSGEPVPLETVIANVQTTLPGVQVQRITLPDGADGSFMVSARQTDEIRSKGSTTIWLDQYSGKILLVRDPKQFAAGNAFINLQLPLHNGEILGQAGRILVLITGFAPLFLMITGVIHWLKKRKANKIHIARLKTS